MVAIAILSVGVLSLARLVPYATRTDYGSRTDSTGTFIAMRELEQMLAQPWGITSFTDAADGALPTPASATVNMFCSCAAPCTTPGQAGAPFVSGTETIDFTAAVTGNYRRTYTIAQPTGNNVKINGGTYEVRWHITCYRYYTPAGLATGGGFDKITVAARPSGSPVPGMIAVPAHVRGVRMR